MDENNVSNDVREETQEVEKSEVDYKQSLKNIKSEFNRKIDNLTASQQELINAITGMKEMKPVTTNEYSEDIDDLILTNPKEAAKRIKEEAKEEMRKELNSQMQTTNEQNQILNELVSDFPELSDSNHDLTIKTLEVYSKLNAKDKNNPLSYKVAVHEAASKLGLLPKAHRHKDSGEFSFSGGKNKSNNSDRRNKIDKSTLAFANFLGQDINDPEYIKKLENYANRDFKKWA